MPASRSMRKNAFMAIHNELSQFYKDRTCNCEKHNDQQKKLEQKCSVKKLY